MAHCFPRSGGVVRTGRPTGRDKAKRKRESMTIGGIVPLTCGDVVSVNGEIWTSVNVLSPI